MMKTISNWGKYPVAKVNELAFASVSQAQAVVNNNQLIARGKGRCYGDASLSRQVVSTLSFNKLIAFNEDTGLLHCEAGLTLEEILEVFVPRGWFLPVTPGTKFITVGGAVASDVHGKNHHTDGSFSNHVEEFTLLLATGEVVTCSRHSNADLFEATCGGMGLTGIILEVKFRLIPIESAYIKQVEHKAANLKEVFSLFEANTEATYSVAWIDCLQKGDSLGRSILMLGEHASRQELNITNSQNALNLKKKSKLTVPIDFPSFTLNKFSVKAFNLAYYNKLTQKTRQSYTDYDTYFYPLDFVNNWNKIYGAKGFVQYQFVLPLQNSYQGLVTILNMIQKKGMGSFLAVLKLFGEQNTLMGFPMKGYTLALDFPVTKGLFSFLDELDKVVHNLGGRIYLSKDARMSAEYFRQGYPDYQKFLSIIEKYNGPESKFSSLLSQRLIPTL
jgi:FAD/FMN-containing dehydrogenase